MSKLVAFFSPSGHTAALAQKLAEATGADLCAPGLLEK